jgi:hypothetical protein
MGTLPDYTQPESVMCYIGFHGTRTPAHKVSCIRQPCSWNDS